MGHRLREQYAIVGVGETEYSRHSGRSTRRMAVEAVRAAMADAGLSPAQVDGLMSYHSGDSTTSVAVATDLGIRPNFFMDCSGGGSSTEALIGLACGAMEMGMCSVVAIYRSMNGYTQFRVGGTGARAAAPVSGDDLLARPYGWMSAGQRFSLTFMRYLYEYGVTSGQVAHVRVAHSKHASNNPKALMRKRVTVEDVLNSRWIVKPLHLLDCCLETDNATCVIVTSAERARDLRRVPALIRGVAGRVCRPSPEWVYRRGPLSRVQGEFAGPRILAAADVTHDDVDVTGCYDAFTFTTVLQLEDYGFCKKGEGGDYVSSGIIELSGRRPNNTSGGHLCEGYTHGMNMVIENVRQLRWQADDSCPGWERGEHSYDYREGGCRQVRQPQISMNMGWGTPSYGSALVLRRGA